MVQLFAEINHDGTLRVQKRRRKASSNERTGSVVEAAKQFLEEVKMEEKEEEGPMADDEVAKSSEQQHTAVLPVVEGNEDGLTKNTVADVKTAEQLDSNKGTVTCNEIVEHKHDDPNEGLVTCNEGKQNDPSEDSVISNVVTEDKQNDGSVTYNEANTNPTDETAEPCNGELTKEQVSNENVRGHEKNEQPPADFLSGTVEYSLIVVMILLLLLQLKMLMDG